MSYDWEEFGAEEAEAEELPYGIKKREVYYVCMRCGSLVSKSELDAQNSLMCPRCGFRIFFKVRAPPEYGRLRRVYAI